MSSRENYRAWSVKLLLKYHDLYTALKRDDPPEGTDRFRQKVAASRCAMVAQRLAGSPHLSRRFTQRVCSRFTDHAYRLMRDPDTDPRYPVYLAFIRDLNYMIESERRNREYRGPERDRPGWAPDWRPVIEGVK